MKKSILFFLLTLLSIPNLLSQKLERRPLMGIAYDTNPTIIDSKYPRGVDIKFVVPNSSAQKAGLQVGDIIIEYQGHPFNQNLILKIKCEISIQATRFL